MTRKDIIQKGTTRKNARSRPQTLPAPPANTLHPPDPHLKARTLRYAFGNKVALAASCLGSRSLSSLAWRLSSMMCQARRRQQPGPWPHSSAFAVEPSYSPRSRVSCESSRWPRGVSPADSPSSRPAPKGLRISSGLSHVSIGPVFQEPPLLRQRHEPQQRLTLTCLARRLKQF